MVTNQSPQVWSNDDQFRQHVREFLRDALTGEFAALQGLGGPGREHESHDERVKWDRYLAEHGRTSPLFDLPQIVRDIEAQFERLALQNRAQP